MKNYLLAGIVLVFYLASCGDKTSTKGLFHSANTGGPKVIFNPDAKPVPIVPFPNDLMTRYDETSPTKLRLNLPLNAVTQLENEVRKKMNTMDGFGTMAPITVSFDKPLNPATVNKNTVFVINIDKNSPDFGNPVQLSFGTGLFPAKMRNFSMFDNDPNMLYDNILFPFNVSENEYSKDTLEPYYIPDEKEGIYTIYLRPLLPLEEGTKYAVVLTPLITDLDDNPIQSPFPHTNHILQTEDLLTLVEGTPSIMNKLNLDNNQIAFAWSFTTQSITKDLYTIRQGFDGNGILSYLNTNFLPIFNRINELGAGCSEQPSVYVIKAEDFSNGLKNFLNQFADLIDLGDFPLATLLDFSYVDYFVFGSYKSPSFIKNSGGFFQIDYSTGNANVIPDKVTFFATIPKQTEKYRAPFPVMLFGHGNSESRIDVFAMANRLAQFGIAGISIDAVGHGPSDYLSPICASEEGLKSLLEEFGDELPISGDLDTIMPAFIILLVEPLADGLCINVDLSNPNNWRNILKEFTANGLIYSLTCEGRARDVDGDGTLDSGEDFFIYDPFVSRDNVRQTIVDQMQLVRILKHLGRDINGNGKIDPEEGDFNLDGIADIGGENNPVFYSGQSLGGILGSVLTAVEPNITRSVLNVPGGTLTDIMTKSTLRGVTMRIFRKVTGPVITSVPEDGMLSLYFNDDSKPFDALEPIIMKNYQILLKNINKGLERTTTAGADGRFWINIPADEGENLELTAIDDSGEIIIKKTITVDAKHSGMGYTRNTWAFRNMIDMSQMAMDAGDPLNYAIHYNNIKRKTGQNEYFENRTLPDYPEKGVLIQPYAADTTVPVSTGIALAFEAGLIDYDKLLEFISNGSIVGLIDNYKNYYGGGSVLGNSSLTSPPAVATGNSESALRIHLTDAHEYFLIPEGTEDIGTDNCPDFLEDGNGGCVEKPVLSPYDIKNNPDPNNDNYCPATNPSGTENNLQLESNEDSSGPWRWRDDGILEVDYTTVAQMQAVMLFRYCKIIDDMPILLQRPECPVEINYQDCIP
jgi:hypothetical protein